MHPQNPAPARNEVLSLGRLGCVACCSILCILLGLGAGLSHAADARGTLCPNPRLTPAGGRSDLLGVYVELSLGCQPGPAWNLQTGLRYTEQRGTTEPFVVLTYQQLLAPVWGLIVSASRRERWGDYEIDRLPELTLRWNPNARPVSLVIPTLDLSVGSIAVARPQVQTTRVGAVLGLIGLPLALRPPTELRPSMRLATYSYGTGQSHSFWVGTVDLSTRTGPRVEVGVVFNHQEGFGVSPLAYDAINFEETLTGRIGLSVTPSTTVILAATVLLTQPPSMKEYVLSLYQRGGWNGSVTWRQIDNFVLFSISLP